MYLKPEIVKVTLAAREIQTVDKKGIFESHSGTSASAYDVDE
jgi:hypothetical protein